MKSIKQNSLNENTQNIKIAPRFLIGVDGGGSGTRITLANIDLQILGTKETLDPSALSLGINKSWKIILAIIENLFSELKIEYKLSEIAIGLGLSGANNIEWKEEFLKNDPGFFKLLLDTDGLTTLMGAHQGNPGIIIALGTGSVGLKLTSDGVKKDVSGWGFPSGDEASGAWIGLKAASLTEKALDGRVNHCQLTQEVLNFCGGTSDAFLKWLGLANQNQFAKLAPLVFKWASRDEKESLLIIKAAALEVALMVNSLDHENEVLPLSFCGRLGEALTPFLPEELKARHIKASADSSFGAVLMINKEIKRAKKA